MPSQCGRLPPPEHRAISSTSEERGCRSAYVKFFPAMRTFVVTAGAKPVKPVTAEVIKVEPLQGDFARESHPVRAQSRSRASTPPRAAPYSSWIRLSAKVSALIRSSPQGRSSHLNCVHFFPGTVADQMSVVLLDHLNARASDSRHFEGGQAHDCQGVGYPAMSECVKDTLFRAGTFAAIAVSRTSSCQS